MVFTGIIQEKAQVSSIEKSQDFSSPEDPRLSFNFSGTQNTSRAGTPINIVFGED